MCGHKIFSRSLDLRIPALDDIENVVSEMRKSDALIMDSMQIGDSALQTVFNDVSHSNMLLGIYKGSVPLAVLGVISIKKYDGLFELSDSCLAAGVPWMVASQAASRYRIALTRISKRILDSIQRDYPHLVTWVAERNLRSINWHKWCGFEFDGCSSVIGNERFLRALRIR